VHLVKDNKNVEFALKEVKKSKFREEEWNASLKLRKFSFLF
jgi:hypothetical protein